MKVKLVEIAKVKPYPGNPRRNDAAVDKVAESIREFGWQQAIVVDLEGVVIAGHTRLLAAKKLGLAKVPVKVAEELTAEQVRAYRIADNRTAEEADWDLALLKIELDDLLQVGVDLSLTAFDPLQLEEVFAQEVKRLSLPDSKKEILDPEEPEEKKPSEPTFRNNIPEFEPMDLLEFGSHQLTVGHENLELMKKIVRLVRDEKFEVMKNGALFE